MDGSLVVQMVKRPRKVMRYSPSAGKHTEHTVERVKKRRASELKWVSVDSEGLLLDTVVSLVQNLQERSPQNVLICYTGALKLARRTNLQLRGRRNSNSWIGDSDGRCEFSQSHLQ